MLFVAQGAQRGAMEPRGPMITMEHTRVATPATTTTGGLMEPPPDPRTTRTGRQRLSLVGRATTSQRGHMGPLLPRLELMVGWADIIFETAFV